MRFIRASVALISVVAGAVVGALNRQAVTIDFAAAAIDTTLGVALLVAVLIGVLVGGLAVAGSGLRLRGRHGSAERQGVARNTEA